MKRRRQISNLPCLQKPHLPMLPKKFPTKLSNFSLGKTPDWSKKHSSDSWKALPDVSEITFCGQGSQRREDCNLAGKKMHKYKESNLVTLQNYDKCQLRKRVAALKPASQNMSSEDSAFRKQASGDELKCIKDVPYQPASYDAHILAVLWQLEKPLPQPSPQSPCHFGHTGDKLKSLPGDSAMSH